MDNLDHYTMRRGHESIYFYREIGKIWYYLRIYAVTISI